MKKKENKRVFISGKITGEPIWECINKFTKAESNIIRLLKLDMRLDMGGNGDVVFNPPFLAGIHFGIKHDEAMEICFNVLETCTHIYMLKDWELSRGAKMEHDMAKEYGLEIIYESDLNKISMEDYYRGNRN